MAVLVVSRALANDVLPRLECLVVAGACGFFVGVGKEADPSSNYPQSASVLARSLDRMEGISGANAGIGFMKSTKTGKMANIVLDYHLLNLFYLSNRSPSILCRKTVQSGY